MNKQEVGVIILGGGYGTRIKKELGKKPKPLAIVSKKPFLYWIIQFLMKQGLSNIIIATHYAHEQINNYIDQMNVNGLNISSVYENFPLGTGGAVINAIVKTKEKYKYYLILNGDSLLTDKFCKLFNISADVSVDGSIYAVHLDDTSRFGTVIFDSKQFLRGFKEKTPDEGYVNAGIYFFKSKFIHKFIDKIENFSLENEFFPEVINKGYKIKTFLSNESFIDIGTPESLIKADAFININYNKLMK